MRQRQPGDRLRVVIAGNIYAKRALVRRFLEDDGFDVAGDAVTFEELLAMGDLGRADAVVVDGDLLHDSIDRVRAVAPDAVIVVVTGEPSGNGSGLTGADGYLEKGVGLASLTALLHSLLSEAPPLPLGLGSAEAAPPPRTERRVLAGLAGVAASIVVVAVVALAVVGGIAPSPTPSPVAQPTAPGSESLPSGPNARELALGDLSDLRDALAAGRPIEASWILDTLQRHLLAAQQAGFSISGIGATAARLLDPFLADVAPDLLAHLRSVFGSVFGMPTATTGSPSGGTSFPVPTSGGTTSGAGGTGGDGGTGGSTGTGDNGGGIADGDGSDGSGTGGDGTGDETPGATSHGRGHHYGWANKPPTGGWHGTKPHPDGGWHGTKPHPDGGWHGTKPHPGGSPGTERDTRGGGRSHGPDGKSADTDG